MVCSSSNHRSTLKRRCCRSVSLLSTASVGTSLSSKKPKKFEIKRRRNKMLEEARKSVPESGRVLHSVSAFERHLTIPKSKDKEEDEEEKDEMKKRSEWAVPLPGLQPPRVSERQESLSPFTPPSGLVFADNFGRDSRVSSSLDSSRGSHSIGLLVEGEEAEVIAWSLPAHLGEANGRRNRLISRAIGLQVCLHTKIIIFYPNEYDGAAATPEIMSCYR